MMGHPYLSEAPMLEHINIALLGCAHIHTPGFVNTMKNRATVTVSSVWDLSLIHI